MGAMTPEGVEVLAPDAVAEASARPDAPHDIVVAAPAGTDPALYESAGATWILITDWIDELRDLAASPAPATPTDGARAGATHDHTTERLATTGRPRGPFLGGR